MYRKVLAEQLDRRTRETRTGVVGGSIRLNDAASLYKTVLTGDEESLDTFSCGEKVQSYLENERSSRIAHYDVAETFYTILLFCRSAKMLIKLVLAL